MSIRTPTIQYTSSKAGRDLSNVALVAVSKRKPIEDIAQAVTAGQTHFGENYLQDAQDKIDHFQSQNLCSPLVWHFIGRIQSNKAKTIAQLFDVVETVDRLKIANALQKHLVSLNKIMQVYVQINIGRESQKAGVMPEDAIEFVKQVATNKQLQVNGLMAMPPFNADPEQTRKYFRQMKELAKKVEKQGVLETCGLSMGMSGDYPVAIEEGATLVRVGTAIFGERS